MPLFSNRLNSMDIFIPNPSLMKRTMKTRIDKIKIKEEDEKACADSAGFELMLQIENHEVDL